MMSSVMAVASTMVSVMVIVMMMMVTSASDCFPDGNSCGHTQSRS